MDCNMPKMPLSRIQTGAVLRALLFGATISAVSPAFADNLPDVQKLVKQGQYPQALSKVDAYLTSRPKDAQGRFLKGLILTELNKPTEAIAIFTKLTEDYPELPEPYNNLAVLYAQQKQYDKARTALEMAIRTHPSYAVAYENLGDIYAKLASQAYDKALQIDSANPTAQNKLALIRDLITTSGKPGAHPEPVRVAVAPTTKVVTSTTHVSAPIAVITPTTVAAVTKPTPPPTATVVPAVSESPKKAASDEAQKKPAASDTPPTANNAANDEVAQALAGWASAWSRKDVRTYLAHYSSDFRTPGKMTRKAWEAQRQDRIGGKGGKIQVSYDTPNITIDGNKATVKFRQHYSAPGLSNTTGKIMVMIRSGGKWLIQEERTN